MQKILTFYTESDDLCANADGWDLEDGDYVSPFDKSQFRSSPVPRCYPSPMHAIGDGWRLLAPPTLIEQIGNLKYKWWLVKE